MPVSNETLDRLVAEKVMGWKVVPIGAVSGMLEVKRPDRCYTNIWPGDWCAGDPNRWSPSHDLNQCREAEIQWGKIVPSVHEYKRELGKIIVPGDPHLITEWAIATADARTRCVAMLTALGVDLEDSDAE